MDSLQAPRVSVNFFHESKLGSLITSVTVLRPMLSTAMAHSEFFARIDRRNKEVISENTVQQKDSRAQRLHSYQACHMKLRPRPTRPLAEASGNTVPERKNPATGTIPSAMKKRKMDGHKQPRPLRSSKVKMPQTPGQFDILNRPQSIPALSSIPDLSPSSSSTSPRKRIP